MRVIVLCGINNSGKTQTLNKLAYLLSKNGCQQFSLNTPPSGYSCKDSMYVFSCPSGPSKKVGIYTAGDTATHIRNGFKYFRLHNCDIVLIASRVYGATQEEIENQVGNGPRPEYVGKVRLPMTNQQLVNLDIDVVAKRLFGML